MAARRRSARQSARREHDSLGEVDVPADRLWGAQTERAAQNFPIGGSRFHWPPAVIRALGLVKKCAALANAELGTLPAETAELIARAADEIIAGRWNEEFPLSAFQSGSGTQTNMNANEVLAHRAVQLAAEAGKAAVAIHPNDELNRGQSTNDVFPTVMHLAVIDELEHRLVPAITELHATLSDKSAAFAEIVMLGRTHLQDAVPVTLGQVISGWAMQLEQALGGIRDAEPRLMELAIGGTAVGTGLNAHPQFGERVIHKLAVTTGWPFVPACNRFAAISAHDALVQLSAALRTLAGALLKIVNDVRWYASGPRGGIGELTIPENEPGSSIMPGKINPSQCEALAMVVAQVFGNDLAVAFAGSQGNFQLNAFKPIILHNVLESIDLLAEGCQSFNARCARGIEPNLPRIREHLDNSLMLVTALAPHIGYERAAEIALTAHHGRLSLREAALQLGYVTADDYDRWIRPGEMTGPQKTE